jgi:hypothetical protein
LKRFERERGGKKERKKKGREGRDQRDQTTKKM